MSDFLRRSQVITTFGPGALIDLPKNSVIVSGLHTWTKAGRIEIEEPRLVAKLRQILELPEMRLFTPPAHTTMPNEPPTHIGARVFPTWFVGQDAIATGPNRQWRRRRLLPWRALDRGQYRDPDDGKRKTVVPVRFVVACRNGHIDDLNWRAYVHRGATCALPLWLEERGTTGDIGETWVLCDCGRSRSLYEAAGEGTLSLGPCRGKRPWLGPNAQEPCTESNRLLVRTASNAYFPQILSAISLPEQDEGVAARVASVFDDFLSAVQSVEDLRYERRKPKVAAALEGLPEDVIMAEIARRRGGGLGIDERPIKQVEFAVLNAGNSTIGRDSPESAFYAETVPRAAWDPENAPELGAIERLVLIHRLREVVAQVGFTRFEAAAPDIEGELDLEVKRAAIDLETTWLPAVEHRGEGVFLSFRPDNIETWMKREAVRTRGLDLMRGFDAWAADHPKSQRKFTGLPFIMLHSLSHLLMTAIALECGYPASSLRERVYASQGMYGILIYTGSSDSEGTLGGLVDTGRRIANHVASALRLAALCSNDPVCAEHSPSNELEARFLLGAACHGCLLIAETSCEQHNDFLDRALVVPTVGVPDAAFFR